MHSVFSNAGDVNLYSFQGSFLDEKDPLVDFEYINNSNDAHCMRASDFDLKLYSDDLYIETSAGVPIKYIGPTRNFVDIIPKVFVVIPPKHKYVASIRLSKYYALPKNDLVIIYALPVIPCQQILADYAPMPPVEFIKSKIKKPSSESILGFSNDYSFWVHNGFLAVSTKLFIKRKNHR